MNQFNKTFEVYYNSENSGMLLVNEIHPAFPSVDENARLKDHAHDRLFYFFTGSERGADEDRANTQVLKSLKVSWDSHCLFLL